MKSCLLAFDCSFNEAGLALLDLNQAGLTSLEPQALKDAPFKNQLKQKSGFIQKTWDSSRSDQLPLKAREALAEVLFSPKNPTAQTRLQLSQSLKFLAVGVGPGRFTGIRIALSFAKSLAYSLQIPICPINSLQLIAESFFEKNPSSAFSKVYVSLQAFKNQVYHGEFFGSNPVCSQKPDLRLLDFKDWEEKMISSPEERLLCLSDLAQFYQIQPQVLKKLQIQKPKMSPWVLIKLALKQGHWIQDWTKIQPNYMRLKI